jgi:hypothetical protein
MDALEKLQMIGNRANDFSFCPPLSFSATPTDCHRFHDGGDDDNNNNNR